MSTVAENAHGFGIAWIVFCAALALHVLDEAMTGFLPLYNRAVQSIRKKVPFVPLPVFSFRVWLGGLCFGILLAFCVSPLAFRGSPFAVAAAYPLGVLMCGNGLGHLGASLFRRRLMPGVYSSPLLVAASVYLLICAAGIRKAALGK